MNWYWYWEILIREAIISVIVFSTFSLVLSVVLKILSKKYVYYFKLSPILRGTAEFLAIASAVISFTGVYSSLIERAYLLMVISMCLVAASIVVAGWTEK